MERQVLEWHREAGLPAAAAAFFLLQEAARSNDSIWWGQADRVDWGDPAVHLEIRHREVAAKASELPRLVSAGVEELLASTVPQEREACVAGILQGDRPVFLSGVEKPLSPGALAALLLPLPKATAEALSVAGWIPSSRYDVERLGRSWDVLVAPRDSRGLFLTSERLEEARLLLASLDTALRPQDQKEDFDVERVADETFDERLEGSAPAIRAADDRSRLQHPNRALHITELPESAPSLLVKLYEFARAPRERWLPPNALAKELQQVAEDQHRPCAQLILQWAEEVERHRPSEADPFQWAVKVALLRAAALITAPCDETLQETCVSNCERTSPLHFLPSLPPAEADRLAALGQSGELVRKISNIATTYHPRWHTLFSGWLLAARPKNISVGQAFDHAMTLFGRADPGCRGVGS